MKRNPRFYRVSVSAGKNRASLVCIAYELDGHGERLAAEFFELVWARDQVHDVPTGRQATFAEQLLAYHNAVDQLEGERSTEVAVLRGKLKRVYGDDAVIHVEGFNPVSGGEAGS